MTYGNILTQPSQPINSNSQDNLNGDLIVAVNDIIEDGKGHQYRFLERLGSGTFGQVFHVVEISDSNNPCHYAIKISKSLRQYQSQAREEVRLHQTAQIQLEEHERAGLCALLDSFSYHGHVCIVMEKLFWDFYKVLKIRDHRGLPIYLVQIVAKHVITVLNGFKRIGLIHTDIKPENIVLAGEKSSNVKLIDLGSAITAENTDDYFKTTIYYRAPEILLHLPYSYPIDMWSFGCVLYELYTGLPFFPRMTEPEILACFVKNLGPIPPEMINASPLKNVYFKPDGSLRHDDEVINSGSKLDYAYYFTIDQNILNYNVVHNQLPEDELHRRQLFCDFLHLIFQYDPQKRLTPEQALQHPFITEKFSDLC